MRHAEYRTKGCAVPASLFKRNITHCKDNQIWESTRPYDKKLFSPKENVSNAGMIVEQITFRIHI